MKFYGEEEIKTSYDVKEFDLNIEKILETWEVHHAIRELIANAIDEQVITGTDDIKIEKVRDVWHIRDYGRGLNYHHLTQNENEEKLNNDNLIGRFGVGLKDALATLYRNNIVIKIKSKFGLITLTQAHKTGFEDIITLHAKISNDTDPNMIGTDISLIGCSDEDINKAKNMFLKFSCYNDILETTKYGQVILNRTGKADIFINGIKVAEEPNFLFSYNITSLNSKIKKSLNRERTNVGRSAYTDRIKSILKECTSDNVIKRLTNDMQYNSIGSQYDELSWGDVALYVSQQMNKLNKNTTFITTSDLFNTPSIVDEMTRQGYTPIVVPDNLLSKMNDYNTGASEGETLTTTHEFIEQKQKSYEPEIINISKLYSKEREIFAKTEAILELIGGKPELVKEIVIAKNFYTRWWDTSIVGLWDRALGRIYIKRNQLSSLKQYAGTLLHECAHARSGMDDVTRDFEMELTDIIGEVVEKLL